MCKSGSSEPYILCKQVRQKWHMSCSLVFHHWNGHMAIPSLQESWEMQTLVGWPCPNHNNGTQGEWTASQGAT